MNPHWIVPDWPAPDSVRAVSTTRHGGVSSGCFDSLNLGAHVGDDPALVLRNRAVLGVRLPAEPLWLEQVHGIAVAEVGRSASACVADAAVRRGPGGVCAIMTADCLPVLFCDQAGTVVAGAHAGWRGLEAGVLEAAVEAMRVPASSVLAWLGPAIGPRHFEVGDEVRAAFLRHAEQAGQAFRRGEHAGKWFCDLYLLARQRLAAIGVSQVSGGGLCTFSESGRFYSFRRDGQTGRMASLVWLER